MPINVFEPVVANADAVSCEEPDTIFVPPKTCTELLTIPEGFEAMLSHVFCVILPLITYLVSNEELTAVNNLSIFYTLIAFPIPLCIVQ